MKNIFILISILCFSCASDKEKQCMNNMAHDFEIKMKVDMMTLSCQSYFNDEKIECSGLTLGQAPIKFECEPQNISYCINDCRLIFK